MTDFKADFKAISAALDERGFCVVPEFLSRDEIDFLVAEFDASPDYSPPTKTRHAAQHLGDKPVAGQTGALRANAMGRRETFQRIGPRTEEFAHGVTGAKAALYQILYLQQALSPGFPSHPGKRLRHHFGGCPADPDWRARVDSSQSTQPQPRYPAARVATLIECV